MAERLTNMKEFFSRFGQERGTDDVLKLKAELDGFTPEQRKRVKSRMESFGIPLVNYKALNYRPSRRGLEGLVGSFQPFNGEGTLYKSIEKLPPAAQDGVMLHETSHSISPNEEKNEYLFGSHEAAAKARNYVEDVVRLTLDNNTYLNGYQAALAESKKEGKIDDMRYKEESWAILCELRFTNPEHLKQVQDSLSQKTGRQIDLFAGVDNALIAVMPNIHNREELNTHIQKLRSEITSESKPVLPNVNLSLAA